MKVGRIIGGFLIILCAGIMLYTIQGAVATVWGVSQFSGFPLTVKLFLPVIFGTLAIVLGVMGVSRLRRRGQSPPQPQNAERHS